MITTALMRLVMAVVLAILLIVYLHDIATLTQTLIHLPGFGK